MTFPLPLVLVVAGSILFALCLAVNRGLISPTRFSQWVGGGACGLALGGAGAWMTGGAPHGW